VVGFNLRSHRLLRQAAEVIRSGALGEIQLLRTLWAADWTVATRPEWHALRSRGGGALLEIGTHQADLWRWLLASEVESVHALSLSVVFDDQTAALQARMNCGALVSAAVSQRSVPHNLVEVLGDRGSLRLSCYHADSLEVERVGGPSNGARRRIPPLLRRARELPAALRAARGGGDYQLSYVHQWQRIATALREGSAMPTSVHDGRQAAAIMLAALGSSDEGVSVVPRAAPERGEVRAG
jgi:predicted dehydrogenase